MTAHTPCAWEVIDPAGVTVCGIAGGSRLEALEMAFDDNAGIPGKMRTDPGYGLSVETFHKLHALNDRTATFAPIAADGWRVVPLPAK